MADNSNLSDVFKFVALRPPVPADRGREEISTIVDSRQPVQTPVGGLTALLNREPEKAPARIREFIQNREYRGDFPGRNSIPARIFEHAKTLTASNYRFDKLVDAVEEILDDDVGDWLEGEPASTMRFAIWDHYYAFLLLSRFESVSLDDLTNHLRAFHLLDTIERLESFDYDTLQEILASRPEVAELYTKLEKPEVPPPAAAPPDDPQKAAEYRRLWGDLIDAHRALDEIGRIRFESRTVTQEQDVVQPNPDTGRESKTKLSYIENRLVPSERSLDALHANTRRLVGEDLRSGVLQPTDAMAQLQVKVEGLYRTASSIDDPAFRTAMPAEARGISGLTAIVAKNSFNPPFFTLPPPTNIRASIKPLGIGDLKVVKQKLKKYVAGEVAHIENVLRGEYKERKHRVLDRNEEIVTISEETTEETTRDTQTTDRFELKKESEKTLQEQMSVQAGVTVSGSYGMVTFGAHGEFAYATASSESNRSSSNFAREVIDKSISKIQKKTREERTTKTLHEVEELNTHGLDNKDKPDHAVGIYRWVDKLYDAQIYNYGKRMMFEFVVPEPAAFWEYTRSQTPPSRFTPPKELPAGLTHRDIHATNFQDFVRDYRVQGVNPPPLPFRTISTSVVKEGMPIDGNAHGVTNKELVVPAGYISKVGLWWDCSAVWTHYPILEITIGNKIFRPLHVPRGDGNFDTRFPMHNNHAASSINYHAFTAESPIQVSVNSYDVLSYTLNIYAFCERTAETYEQWQITTFEKVLAAYQAQLAEYEQKVAAQETSRGIAITGQDHGAEPAHQPRDRTHRAQEALREDAHGQLSVRQLRRDEARHIQSAGVRHLRCARRRQDHPVLRAGVRMGEHDLPVLSLLLGALRAVDAPLRNPGSGPALRAVPSGRLGANRAAGAPGL
jgi:hypothetical protein